jgi:xanthine dehydrogenase YagR molybdenum-binding subunit
MIVHTDTLLGVVGRAHPRLEGQDKAAGTARYAVEYPVEGVAYAWAVPATIARGRIIGIEAAAALVTPGVLAVMSHENAPRLASVEDPDVFLLQGPDVAYRGQIVAVAVADSLEAAREAATLVRVEYDAQQHHTELSPDDPGLYKPDTVNPWYETDTASGDFDGGYAASPIQVDHEYRTPAYHHNAMEPHAATAAWSDRDLLVYDSNQGSTSVQESLVAMFGLAGPAVRVVNKHVGGGFGGKGFIRGPAVLAALAARLVGRPVRLALTRQQLFTAVGYRTPTIQRVRLGAAENGRLAAISHDVISQTSTFKEFAEQTAVYTRSMYAAPHRRTTHRLVRLDVPTPVWMRAPGECPGSFGLESAMDELAVASGIDPIELRIRNEPAFDPATGNPFSSRNLVACLREGARRFGWARRDPTPGVRRDRQGRHGQWLTGTGVAGCAYPTLAFPSSAIAHAGADGSYRVQINATDIGTGARTALWQIAADELDVPPERVTISIGDSDLPPAFVAGASSGTASWGWAVRKACAALRQRIERQRIERQRLQDGSVPAEGVTVQASTADDDLNALNGYARFAYGAQFAEVHVDVDTGEVRVGRLLGVFAAGRIVNPTTARSQFIGGMTMGLSMALHEEAVLDPRFGDWINHDFARYHIASCADVNRIEAYWLDEHDPYVNPLGTKGIGEIGIVGTAAAVANAVHHATGVRVRELPVRLDKLLV